MGPRQVDAMREGRTNAGTLLPSPFSLLFFSPFLPFLRRLESVTVFVPKRRWLLSPGVRHHKTMCQYDSCVSYPLSSILGFPFRPHLYDRITQVFACGSLSHVRPSFILFFSAYTRHLTAPSLTLHRPFIRSVSSLLSLPLPLSSSLSQSPS